MIKLANIKINTGMEEFSMDYVDEKSTMDSSSLTSGV